MEKIDVIIVSKYTFNFGLKKCIDNILKNTDRELINLIVISHDYSKESKDYFDYNNIIYIFKKDNSIDYTKLINEGVNLCNNPFFIVMDERCVLLDQNKNHWIDNLRTPFENNSKCVITSPYVIKNSFQINYVSLFCFMMSRTFFNKINGFKENCQWFENSYFLCNQANENNYEIIMASSEINEESSWIFGVFPIYFKDSIEIKCEKKFNQEMANSLKEKFEREDNSTYNEIYKDVAYKVTPLEIENKIVFDIGANVGMFSLRALELGAKEVLAIEANPRIFNILVNNMTFFPSVKAINKAVYHIDNEIVKISENDTSSSISTEGYDIQTVTLKSLVDLYPNEKDMILKMDCEGAEFNIILNTSKEVIRRFKVIDCEVHENYNINPLYRGYELFDKTLESFGYERVYVYQIYSWQVNSETQEIFNKKELPARVQKWIRKDL